MGYADEKEFEFEDILHESDKAWKLLIYGEEIWLPKSQCQVDKMDYTVLIPEWLAEQKGLI